nr:hypothetical protein CFP56_16263 [Quercus suber]
MQGTSYNCVLFVLWLANWASQRKGLGEGIAKANGSRGTASTSISTLRRGRLAQSTSRQYEAWPVWRRRRIFDNSM